MCWNFKFISVLVLSLFLLACGGAATDDPVTDDPATDDPATDDPEQLPPIQVNLLSANVNLSKISIDLNDENSAEIVLTRTFDDDSETKLNLVIAWDADKLVLRDDSDNVIEFSYDKNALLSGPTAIKFSDPGSDLEIEFEVELILASVISNEPVFLEVNPSTDKLEIDLNVGSTASFNLVRKFDGGSDVIQTFSFFFNDVQPLLHLDDDAENEVTISFDETSLNTGSIEVTFNDPVSNEQISIEVVIIALEDGSDPDPQTQTPTIEKYILSPEVKTIDAGKDVQLNISILMSDGSSAVVPSDIECKLETPSNIISVTSGCLVTGLQEGGAEVTLIGTQAIDDGLIQKSRITVLAPYITKAAITSNNVTIVEGLDAELFVTLTYSNGVYVDNDFNLVKCLSNSNLISVTDDCIVTGKSVGLASVSLVIDGANGGHGAVLIPAQVEVAPAIITRIWLSTEILKVQVGDAQTIIVMADYSNGLSRNITAESDCLLDMPTSVISLNDACKFFANELGVASINVVLKNNSSVSVSGDVTVSTSFPVILDVNQPNISYEVMDVSLSETYKVTLSIEDETTLVPFYINMKVQSDLNSTELCQNWMPQYIGYSVACGVKASSDILYVDLELSSNDVANVTTSNAIITIEPDANVLTYAGPLKSTTGYPDYFDKYNFEPLTLDTILLDGHVPANISGENTSRYMLSIEEPEKNSAKYSVTIKFDSMNFDENTAIVRWYGGAKVGEPESQCLFVYKPGTFDSLVCELDNAGQTNIFVEVRGNGAFGSVEFDQITSIDGEIGYTILFEQIP